MTRPRAATSVAGKARSSRNAIRHGILTEAACAAEGAAHREAYSMLLDELRAELAPASLLESLLVERIAAALWRTRRVLAFEAGTALERDSVPEPGAVRVLRDIETCGPSDPAGFERGRELARALAPAGAVDLAIRYEAHLTREVGRLLTQLEQARRLSALVDSDDPSADAVAR